LSETTPGPTLVIPEARSLNGGLRFLEGLQGSTLPVEFVPDAAIATAVKGCDLALIGAETIGADGSCYNTVGSLSVALACDYWRVPLYVPSTLIKLDTRTLFGYQRPMPALDQHRLSPLTADWPATLRSRAKVLSPDLDCVPPTLIAAYITEVGVLPPAQVAAHAARLAEALPHD
jgi:translation initiation factor 2B subunit (eIF-2B alpha/beta/delta family)